MAEWISFTEVLERTSDTKPAILLGNGFSRGVWDKFKYEDLRDKAEFEKPQTRKMFEILNTDNFEEVIRHIDGTTQIMQEVFPESIELWNSELPLIKKDLQEWLCKAIRNVHPDSLPAQKTAADFLKHFSTIFTLNYDLLLYWSRLDKGENHFSDGFRKINSRLIFKEKFGEKKVYNLHGGMYLFNNEWEVEKLNAKTGRLIGQIEKRINEWKMPLFVCEWNSENKLNAIKNNSYLYTCYQALKQLNYDNRCDNLVTFGVSFGESDDHILDAIQQSKVLNVYIWCRDGMPLDNHRRVAWALKEKKNVFFYNSTGEDVHIWQEKPLP